jgi:hypothetical protein
MRPRSDSRGMQDPTLRIKDSKQETCRPVHRRAYGYMSLTDDDDSDTEASLREQLVCAAALDRLELAGVFMDRRGQQPYGFAAMRELLRRSDAATVLLPNLTHVEHISAVARLSRAGLARWLGAAVLLTDVLPVPLNREGP